MAFAYSEYTPTNRSVYEMLEQSTQEYMDSVALYYYGYKVTYRRLFEKIDEVAQALQAMGVGKNDVVASSLVGMPEGVYLLYAINKIGAVYCAFDCRSRTEELKETVEKFAPKACFIPDFQLDEFKGVTGAPIVYVSPVSSVNKWQPLVDKVTNFFKGRTGWMKKQGNFISYAKFKAGAANGGTVTTATADNNRFGYFYTSGTTYGRKSIILTNENINAAALQQQTSLAPVPGESVLNIMPLFTCYSVTLAVHLPLISGVRVTLLPLLDTKKMKEKLLKYQPNYIISVPAHWEHFIKSEFEPDCDLSFMKKLVVGGDVLSNSARDKINEIFATHGGTTPLMPGYGLSETTSTTTSAYCPSPVGSVGYPLMHTRVAIFDPDTGAELPAGQPGEICTCGPTVCDGYYQEEEMTAKLLRRHEDGKIWLHSGDCGYMDESGAVFFCERYKRMYVRHDGTKVSPYSIEQVIGGCPMVDRCLVVPIRDVRHEYGMCPKAIIVPKAEHNNPADHEKIKKYIEKNIAVHLIPRAYDFVEKLPITKMGKVDYFAAQEQPEAE